MKFKYYSHIYVFGRLIKLINTASKKFLLKYLNKYRASYIEMFFIIGPVVKLLHILFSL